MRGNNATCPALHQLSVTSSTIHKQIGPSWCRFPGGWTCAWVGFPWVSLTNSPVRLGVSPTAAIPIGLRARGFGALFPCTRTLGCVVCQPPPHLPCHPATTLLRVLSAWLPTSAPPTGLDECFFFNSLVPHSSIF